MRPAARLRHLLATEAPVVAPGAYNALFARLIAEAGFPAVYLSGAGVANSLLGRPDIGLVTMSEMAMIAERVCEVVDVPVIADGDTGYGGVHNVARTIRAYERAGVAAIQLEDQVFPKKCGHFEGKEVVGADQMLQRIEAALDARSDDDGILVIARTDARAPIGLEEAIDRARRYGEAGADILFVEAPQTVEELARVGDELGEWPLLANMVEFGKTPLLPADELADLGFSLVITPGAITRVTTKAAEEVLAELKRAGTTKAHLDRMKTFGAVNEMLGLPEANAWEAEIAERAARRMGG
ncbi:MAG TPA: isocitrate lyase/phosphoenolpyruvate mutase family protein [Acidimicrobiia bacterium]|nr:isocitrate lyase/phosphoenolpyruvate mutase family protein [Acidimicrobiia bacterium]